MRLLSECFRGTCSASSLSQVRSLLACQGLYLHSLSA